MANTTINDVAVIRGEIHMPLVGVWVADLVVDQPDGKGFATGTKVTIKTKDLMLVGTVAPDRSGDFLDTIHVRVLGGGAGMAKPAKVRGFMQPRAFTRDIIGALMADGGESVSASSDPTFLGSNLTAWMIKKGTVADNLRALLQIKAPTFNWRILADGTLWMGVETWPEATGELDILHQDPADRSYELGIESPWILPGTKVPDIGNIGSVMHTIERTRIRSSVLVEIPGEERGLAGSLAAIAAQQMAQVDYFGLYRSTVITQPDATTVDVQPDSDRFGGLQRVPIRLGIPGTTVQFAPGAKVLLGWMGGDPSQPYVMSHGGDETLYAVTIGSPSDNVVTKQDLTAVILALQNAKCGGSGAPLAFTTSPLPTEYASNAVKVQR